MRHLRHLSCPGTERHTTHSTRYTGERLLILWLSWYSYVLASQGYLLLTLCVMTDSQLTAWEDFGCQHWGNAAQANGLFGSMECLQDILHFFGDCAVLSLGGPSTQVFSHSKATWEEGNRLDRKISAPGQDFCQVWFVRMLKWIWWKEAFRQYWWKKAEPLQAPEYSQLLTTTR